MELWLHTASNDEQTKKTTNRVRKSPISNMAAMLWRKVVINFDNPQATQTYYVSLNEYINIHMDKLLRWVVETPIN